jgi:hypothetical protein
MSEPKPLTPDSPEAHINRELSWLSFARRVLALAEDGDQPLLERVKFAGIMGMIYDEFAMKRIGGLRRQVQNGDQMPGPDGLTPAQELAACRQELRAQQALVARVVEEEPLCSPWASQSATSPGWTQSSATTWRTTSPRPSSQSSPRSPRTPPTPSPLSATWGSTWRCRSQTQAGTAATSCASRFPPTAPAGSPSPIRPAGCRWSR